MSRPEEYLGFIIKYFSIRAQGIDVHARALTARKSSIQINNFSLYYPANILYRRSFHQFSIVKVNTARWKALPFNGGSVGPIELQASALVYISPDTAATHSVRILLSDQNLIE